jgi:hypothetical protein
MTAQITEARIAQLEEAIRKGEISELAALQLVREAVAQGAVEGQQPPVPTPDPRKAAPITESMTERQILVSALMRAGADRTEALEASLVTDPSSAQDIVKAETERLQARADAAARAQYDATAAGKLERGQQLAAERAERERLVAPARELLREQGLTDADIDAVAGNTDDLLVMAGLQEPEPPPKRDTGSRLISEGLPPTAEELRANLVAAGEITEGSDGA